MLMINTDEPLVLNFRVFAEINKTSQFHTRCLQVGDDLVGKIVGGLYFDYDFTEAEEVRFVILFEWSVFVYLETGAQ